MGRIRLCLLTMCSVLGAQSLAMAQDFAAEPQDPSGKFLTATEIKQILPHTKNSWIAVRPYDGQDLLYFTNLLAWRCGLHQISFAINGGALQPLITEPCYADEAAPNALKMDTGVLPYVAFGPDTIKTIQLHLLYDDMSEETARFDRQSVQIN